MLVDNETAADVTSVLSVLGTVQPELTGLVLTLTNLAKSKDAVIATIFGDHADRIREVQGELSAMQTLVGSLKTIMEVEPEGGA